MSDNQGREAPSAPAPSRIVLTFAAEGAADLTAALEHVTLGQLMAAATFLDIYVRELRDQQLAAQGPRLVLADRLPSKDGRA